MSNDEWRTPEWVWKPYGPFDLDAAATAENTLAPKFITKEMNALTYDWALLCPPGSKVWCNPPYSKEAGPLNEWVRLFQNWRYVGYEIIACLPADTSTKWFARIDAMNKKEEAYITFLQPRVRFIDAQTGKPGGSPKFGTMIVRFVPW